MNGFSIDMCGSRMPSHFGKGIYTSKLIDVALYYCYEGIYSRNAYNCEKGDHFLIACLSLIINEYKIDRDHLGNRVENIDRDLYNVVTYKSETKMSRDIRRIHSETVVFNTDHIVPLYVIKTKDLALAL